MLKFPRHIYLIKKMVVFITRNNRHLSRIYLIKFVPKFTIKHTFIQKCQINLIELQIQCNGSMHLFSQSFHEKHASESIVNRTK